jgi:hypothetical protein
MNDLSPELRAWLVSLVQAQAWPWATMAQILDEKGVVPMSELRARFEGSLHAMKVGLATPGIDPAIRPDVILMQTLVDALKGLEANAEGKPPHQAN